MLKKSMISLSALLCLCLLLHHYAFAETVPFPVSAQSAVLMDQQSGRVLYAKNAHQRRRIASITKIMTAIIAIESGKMDQTVTISKRAAYTEGSSLYLKPGEKMKLKDLVYGLMLRSGNDAAVAIAECVGGSVEGFTHMMNQKAELIGMEDTRFANPHGLDDHRDMYSSAYDMALLTKYAMQNRMFRKIAGTKIYRAPDPDGKGFLVWKNKNKLLTRYKYSTGGKTGYTTIAKRTLVSTAKKGDMSLIAVTLNDRNDWEDHVNMFQYGFKHYDPVTLVRKGAVSGIENSFYKGKVYVKQPVVYPLTKDEEGDVSKTINLYDPPKKGEWKDGKAPSPVGKLFVRLDDQVIAERPLYFKSGPDIERTGIWGVFRHIFVVLLGVHPHD